MKINELNQIVKKELKYSESSDSKISKLLNLNNQVKKGK